MVSDSKERNSRFLFRSDPGAWIAAIACAAFALSACTDARVDAIPQILDASPPEGLAVAGFDSDFKVERAPDGSRQARIAVRYLTTEPRFAVERLRSGSPGSGFARRLDAVTEWATTTLPPEDPLRSTILESRARMPLDALIKAEVMPVGAEVPANVTITWDPSAAPDAGRVISLPPELPGVLLENPDATLTAGSPGLDAANSAIQQSLTDLETQRDEWIARAEREARTRDSIARWKALFRLGAVFKTAPDAGVWRFVVTRGIDAQNRLDWTITSESNPTSGARFTGSLRILPDGDVLLQPRRSTVFAPPAADSTDAAWLLDDPAPIRITLGYDDRVELTLPDGKTLVFQFEKSVDVLPPVQAATPSDDP